MRENVDSMPAGREMDALVAERVMGCKTNTAHDCLCPKKIHSFSVAGGLKRYSTEIAAAWEVVEKAESICLDRGAGYKTYQCCYNGSIAAADTAPLAICRAALKAVGV